MSLITNIRNFFKRIFNKDVEALPKPTEELHENKDKIVRTSENNEISEKKYRNVLIQTITFRKFRT